MSGTITFVPKDISPSKSVVKVLLLKFISKPCPRIEATLDIDELLRDSPLSMEPEENLKTPTPSIDQLKPL